jgi:hypothetical protein
VKAEALDCPFVRPVMADQMWMYPTGAYCRLPSGRVSVPSRDTLACLCTSGRYSDCPAYRRWRHAETGVKDLG